MIIFLLINSIVNLFINKYKYKLFFTKVISVRGKGSKTGVIFKEEIVSY